MHIILSVSENMISNYDQKGIYPILTSFSDNFYFTLERNFKSIKNYFSNTPIT